MNANADALREALFDGLRATLDEVLPWFLDQMPSAYFTDTSEQERIAHLMAVVTARMAGQPPRLTLRSEDGSRWTFISDADRPGQFGQLLAQLPPEASLRLVKVHTSRDTRLSIDTVVLGEAPRFDPTDEELSQRREAALEYARGVGADVVRVDRFLRGAAAEFVRAATPLRVVRASALFDAVSGTDDTAVFLEPERDPELSRIVVALGNASPRRVSERCAAALGARGINILRAYVDVAEDGENGTVTALTYIVRAPDGRAIDPESELWKVVASNLTRMKWVADSTLALVEREPSLGLVRCEVIVALASLVHQCLVRENPYAFSRAHVFEIITSDLALPGDIASLLLERFDPSDPLDGEAWTSRVAAMHKRVKHGADGDEARRVLLTMLLAVERTLRCNVHFPRRYGLALRLDPTLVTRADAPEVPFGVYFVHGLGFDGFHLRFRDIARGGVRVVRPGAVALLAAERNRLYDEVYGLAYAQQLKNKDIPEGGAKAVIVAAPEISAERAFKGFVDGLLDLMIPSPELAAADHLGRAETLYLGPDENITPALIEWAVSRARRRGHSVAGAFMSSKPGAGINHKEYGVTSEGVTVFLDVALHALGIDPRAQDFTIKLTGGPDGDVAGNEIKILHREYGERARIVGIADGSGALEDPDGLDHAELLRLVARSEPAVRFDPARLGPRGKVIPVDGPEGVRARNTLHNRVQADVFIPAGGRPQTIHGENWRAFLLADGTPSARVIVEGANLFITPDAREALGAQGVVILKDSSANKCGVICSSLEITASHLLTEQEFLASKPRFVTEVLERLRALARAEAELLFRERAKDPTALLPELSVRLSRAMMRVQDAIDAVIDDLPDDDRELVDALVLAHLPPVLRELARDRVATQLPAAYVRSIASSSLAARIVYREGLGWVSSLPDATLGRSAFLYLRGEREAEALAASIRRGDAIDRDQAASLVARTGARDAVERSR